MLNSARKLQTSLAAAVLCLIPVLSFAEEPVSVPAQPASVEKAVVSEVLVSAEPAEPVMAPAEVKSMIEDEVLMDLSSRLIAAAPSS